MRPIDPEKLIDWAKARIKINGEALATGQGDAGPLNDHGKAMLEGAAQAYGRLINEVYMGRLDLEEDK